MAGINKVILVGNLGKDPEVKTHDSGVKMARFTLATNETYTDRAGERKDITEWHNIVCWRNLAEIAEKYLNKGKQIYLEGRLRTRKYTDQNNIERYTTEILADTFQMLGRSERDADTQSVPAGIGADSSRPLPEAPYAPPVEEDDLPF